MALNSGLPEVWGMLFSCLFTSPLGWLSGQENSAERSLVWIDEWLLGRQIVAVLKEMRVDAVAAERNLPLLRLLVGQAGWLSDEDPRLLADRLIWTWTQDEDARRFLQVHMHEEVQWFNKECFHELVWWSFAAEVITCRLGGTDKKMVAEEETNETASATETTVPARLAQDDFVRDNIVQLIDGCRHEESPTSATKEIFPCLMSRQR